MSLIKELFTQQSLDILLFKTFMLIQVHIDYHQRGINIVHALMEYFYEISFNS